MSKIQRKLLILGLLIAGVFFVTTSNNQSVNAAPCCTECDEYQEICLAPDHGGYATYAECATAYRINRCYMHCVQCGGGGNCGASCGGDWDCGGGWGCEFCIQGTCQ